MHSAQPRGICRIHGEVQIAPAFGSVNLCGLCVRDFLVRELGEVTPIPEEPTGYIPPKKWWLWGPRVNPHA